MSRDDVQKLLGGYATGTLTPEERQALFEAALEDQELFDTLAREEALREVLSDPAARAHLLAVVDETPEPWYRRWWRPAVVLATASALVLGVALWQKSLTPPPLKRARWRPPVQAERVPVLPPPPELARATPPPVGPLKLPGGLPAVAPPPPIPIPAANELKKDVDAVSASASIDGLPQARSQNQFDRLPTLPPTPRFAPSAAKAPIARSDVPLHGVVTDASGAVVPSATVSLKSMGTGAVTATSTNERGEFSAPAVAGGTYRISASAPGFRSATATVGTPLYGEPEPVNLKLEVGAAAETVDAASAAASYGASTGALAGSRGGRGGGGSAAVIKRPAALPQQQAANANGAAAPPPPAPPLGLDYRILRRMPAGDLVEIAADRTVVPGANLVLQIIPNADGYVRLIRSNGRAIVTHAVLRGQPFQAQLPKIDKPQREEFRLVFSRSPLPSNGPAVAQRATAGAVPTLTVPEQISLTIAINFQR